MSRGADDEFNPYRSWLGIPAEELPANHYRLLGLSLYEDDPEIIESAADRQMTHIKTFQIGQHAAHSQRLLNEISHAAAKLRNPQAKANYDAKLKAKLDPPPAPLPIARPTAIPVAKPLPPRPMAVPQAPMVPNYTVPNYPPPPLPLPQQTNTPLPVSRTSPTPRVKKKEANAVFEMAKVVGGGIFGLLVAWVLLRMIGKSGSIDEMVVGTKPPPVVVTPVEPKKPAEISKVEVKPPPAVVVPMPDLPPATPRKEPVTPSIEPPIPVSPPIPNPLSPAATNPSTPVPPPPTEVADTTILLPPPIPAQAPVKLSPVEQVRESMEYAVLLYDYLKSNLQDEAKREQARKLHDLAIQITTGAHPVVQMPMDNGEAGRFLGHYISQAQTPVIGNLPNSNLRTISIVPQVLPRGKNAPKIVAAERIFTGLDELVVNLRTVAEDLRTSGESEAADSHLILLCACRTWRLSFERGDYDHWELLYGLGAQMETARLTVKDPQLSAANSAAEETLLGSFNLMTTGSGELHRDLRQTFSTGKTIFQHRQDGRWEETTNSVKKKHQEISRTPRLIVLQDAAGKEQTFLYFHSFAQAPVGSPPPDERKGGNWRILTFHLAK